MHGVHLDNRWSPIDNNGVRVRPTIIDYLSAGCGYGGCCFAIDVAAISSLASDLSITAPLLSAVISINEKQPKVVIDILKKEVVDLSSKSVLLLGLAFKPNTDDMRDSSSLKMIPALSKKGAKINYFDPTGLKKELSKIKNVFYIDNIKESVQGSDLVIIHTEWNDFKSINFKSLVRGKKFIIYDMRNIYSPMKIKNQGFKYYSIGR